MNNFPVEQENERDMKMLSDEQADWLMGQGIFGQDSLKEGDKSLYFVYCRDYGFFYIGAPGIHVLAMAALIKD